MLFKLKLTRASETDMSKRKSPSSRSSLDFSSDDSRTSSSHSVNSDYSLRSGVPLQKRRRSFCDNDLFRDGSTADGNFRLRRHSFTVQISERSQNMYSNLGCQGEALSDNSSVDRNQQKPAFKEIHFSCPMGDMYSPAYYEQSQRGKIDVRKSDKLSDIINGLEFSGYTATKLLHKGRFSHIVLAYTNFKHNSKYIAIKVLEEPTSSSDDPLNSEGDLCLWLNPRLLNEVVMLQGLHHKNIIRMLEHITVQQRTMLFLEFCCAGNLENLIRIRDKGFLVEGVAKRYFYQVLAGLTFIHDQSVVHRDLQPLNILVDANDQLKICDFRTARKVSEGEKLKSNDVILSPYHAPEVFQGRHNPLTADIWALGAILYVMLFGQPPYGEEMEIVTDCCINAKFIEPINPGIIVVSPDAYQIIQGLLHITPETRFSLRRISNLRWNSSQTLSSSQVNPPRTQVVIGNFHLCVGLHKLRQSSMEKKEKKEFQI